MTGPIRRGELARTGAPRRELTAREMEVARLVAIGLRNREIASALAVSVRTADSHVERILEKLGFRSRVQIARWMAQSESRSASS